MLVPTVNGMGDEVGCLCFVGLIDISLMFMHIKTQILP